MSSLLKVILPVSGTKSRPIKLRIDVVPDPEDPTNALFLPDLNSN